MNLANEATRAYIYRVIATVIPILVLSGYLAGDQVQLWLNLAAAVLGLAGGGLAAAHTTTKGA